jgi:hypothetical protein
MENNTPACLMNQRGYSDGELGPIVDPHDITGSHTLEKGPEDAAYDPAMKEPRQLLKAPSQVLIKSHSRQNANRILGKVPRAIRARTHNYNMRCAAEDVSSPA